MFAAAERSGAERSGAERSRWLPSAEGWGRSAAERSGWLEFLALARCFGLRVGRGQSQKPATEGWSVLEWGG